MTLESVVRVVATCDRCGQVARAGEQVVQWVDEEAALRDLSGPVMGWIACAQTQICGGCVARSVCGSRGHAWGEWAPVPAALEPPAGTSLVIRVCGRCGRDDVGEVETWMRPA